MWHCCNLCFRHWLVFYMCPVFLSLCLEIVIIIVNLLITLVTRPGHRVSEMSRFPTCRPGLLCTSEALYRYVYCSVYAIMSGVSMKHLHWLKSRWRRLISRLSGETTVLATGSSSWSVGVTTSRGSLHASPTSTSGNSVRPRSMSWLLNHFYFLSLSLSHTHTHKHLNVLSTSDISKTNLVPPRNSRAYTTNSTWPTK